MSKPNTAPPRIPPTSGSIAAFDQRLAAHRAAVEALASFKIDGCTVFESGHDGVSEILFDLAGLTELLNSAFVDADGDRAGMLAGTRSVFVARTIGAINKLTALALFINEGSR